MSLSVVLGAWNLAAKTGPTYYTPDRVQAARENVARYTWAKAIRKRIFETGDPIVYYIGPTYTAADVFVRQSDEFMWMLQPSTTLPRVAYPRDGLARCPVHGDAVKRISVWNPWHIDPITHPYQVQCPIGKEWYPSNAYAEGDMTSGDFPDDGSGCLHQGIRYFFLREYAHMVYGSVVIPTLRSLSQAYQLTGDTRYARKGCILLARLATQYPNYGWDKEDGDLENRFDRTYLGPWNNRHPHYHWKQGGMITDLIWETFCLEATAYAYDGLWDYMDKDPDMLAFLRRKGMPITTGDDLRHYIETYIFRAAMRALQAGWIKGNEGFHQAAALAVALVLDDYSDHHPNSQDMVDYAYHGSGRSIDIMRNGLLPDGGGHESPNYSKIKLDFIRVTQLMECIRKLHPERFPASRYPDLFGDPKAKALFDFYIDMLVCDGRYPSIGDCSGLSVMKRYNYDKISALTHENIFAVLHFGDPRHARACLDAEGNLCTGELWEPFPEKIIRDLAAQPGAEPKRVSRLLDPYGIAILESGDHAHRRTAVLNYSSLLGHRQRDQLNLEIHARHLAMLQDLGYPKTWEYRDEWDANSMAHNTVTIDETLPDIRSTGGLARLFASEGGVHVVTAAHEAYRGAKLGNPKAPPVTVYERTVVLVDVDPNRFFVVDLFLANGGEQHDQSWHAFRGPMTPPDLPWRTQQSGTLAGPDIERFSAYTDRWGRKRTKGWFPSYLSAIRRAPLTQPAAWTWRTSLPEGDGVRLHLVPLDGTPEVIMGKGRSPVRKDLDFILLRKKARGSAPSRFLTVIDPFQGKVTVQRVVLLGDNPLRLRVETDPEIYDITLSLPPGLTGQVAPRAIGVMVHRQDAAGTSAGIAIGTLPGSDSSGYAGAVIEALENLDTNSPTITLRLDDDKARQAMTPGRWIRIFGPRRSTMVRVLSATPGDDRRLSLTLDKTALLAEGDLVSLEGTTLKLDAHLLFAPVLGGAYVSGSGFRGRVVSARKEGVLTLENLVRDPAVTPAPGTLVRLWQYAVGNRVEAPMINRIP